jgi:hypothetical protein
MRNPLIHSLGWLALTAAVAGAQATNPIQRLVLDPLALPRIPVAVDRLTTVRLPSPPSDIESARVSTEPHPDALFLFSIQPGSASFSVRALCRNTNTTLNLSWKNQTYVFEFFESPQPWLSVTFDPPMEPAPRTVSSVSRAVPPGRLLGMLDTAKAYGLLRQQHPAAVAGIEVVRPNTLRDYGTYTILTEEVFRFDAEDTLVFRIVISNPTGMALQYVPESLMVRAGTRIYYQSIAEAAGTVPPHSATPVYFAVTGSPDGTRNALSPKNDFLILLQRVEAVTTLTAAPNAVASTWPPPPAPAATAVPPAAPPAQVAPHAAFAAAERAAWNAQAAAPPTWSPPPRAATPPRVAAAPAMWQPSSPPAIAPVRVVAPQPVSPSPAWTYAAPPPLPPVDTWADRHARRVAASRGYTYQPAAYYTRENPQRRGGFGFSFEFSIGFR